MGWQRCFFSKKYFDGLSVLLLYYLAVLVVHQHIHVMAVGATSPSSAKFYRIHWNSSNPIFRIDNTDNIIDVNRNNAKFEYDQVNLICPVYTPGTTQDDEMEKYIIYNVSKDEYDTCRITNPNPRIIAVCDKPYKLMYFTITFRPFTPQPGGLEFLPGHDYYFISTSTSDDLHRRIGGRCTTHNMKIVFKVWGPAAPPPPPTVQPPQAPSINSGATRWWKQVTSSPPSRTASSSSANDPPLPPYHFSTPSYPPPPYYVTANGGATLPPNSQGAHPTATTKKSKTYNKHPNEVVKSEELTLGGGTSSSSSGASTRPNNNKNNVIINKLSLLIVCAATIVVICGGGGAWQR